MCVYHRIHSTGSSPVLKDNNIDNICPVYATIMNIPSGSPVCMVKFVDMVGYCPQSSCHKLERVLIYV